jgi:hypothetical protein
MTTKVQLAHRIAELEKEVAAQVRKRDTVESENKELVGRLFELEEERDDLMSIIRYVDSACKAHHDGESFDATTPTDLPERIKSVCLRRDFEQRAKGIDDYADGVTMDILKVAMQLHAERLRKQAKALGEQK